MLFFLVFFLNFQPQVKESQLREIDDFLYIEFTEEINPNFSLYQDKPKYRKLLITTTSY